MSSNDTSFVKSITKRLVSTVRSNVNLPSNRVLFSILLYVIVMCLIIYTHPTSLFEDEKSYNIRRFGVSYERDTVFSFGVISVFLAILIFYIACLIDAFSH